MVSKRTVGGLLAGSAVAFGGILYFTIRSLTTRSGVLGCVADNAACQSVTAGLSMSHIGVGFISALFSLGLYFLFFHRDDAALAAEFSRERQQREERIELLTKVMTPGEQAVLGAVLKEEGILQSTLGYRTNLTPGRISQVLSEFEKSGLVSRKPEGRSYRVYVSF